MGTVLGAAEMQTWGPFLGFRSKTGDCFACKTGDRFANKT